MARVRDGHGPRNKGILSTRTVPEKGGARRIEGRVGGGVKKTISLGSSILDSIVVVLERAYGTRSEREIRKKAKDL